MKLILSTIITITFLIAGILAHAEPVLTGAYDSSAPQKESTNLKRVFINGGPYCGNYSQYFFFQNAYKEPTRYFEGALANITSTLRFLEPIIYGKSKIFITEFTPVKEKNAVKSGVIVSNWDSDYNILCQVTFACEQCEPRGCWYTVTLTPGGGGAKCAFGPGFGTETDPYSIILKPYTPSQSKKPGIVRG